MVLKQGQRTKGRGAFIRSLKCFKTESAKWGKHLENDLLGPSPPITIVKFNVFLQQLKKLEISLRSSSVQWWG